MHKLLMVIPGLGTGGAERICSVLANILEADINVFSNVCCQQIKDNITITNSDVSARNGSISKAINLVKRVIKLRAVIKANNYINAISFMESANFVLLLSCANVKKIVTVHEQKSLSPDLSGIKGVAIKLLIKLLYPLADHIIAVSYGVKSDLCKTFGIREDKVQVLYNSFDLNRIRQSAQFDLPDKLKQIFGSNKIIINAGRLSYQKNQEHLIRIFAAIRKKKSDTKLIILGEGELEGYLVSLCQSLGLETCVWTDVDDEIKCLESCDVFFMGYQQNPYLYFAKSSLLILTSRYEGFGNVLVEAMAVGLPVISVDCPSGPREIISGKPELAKNSCEIEEFNVGALLPLLHQDDALFTESINTIAQYIYNLLENPELLARMSEAALTLSETYDNDVMIKEWIALLKSE